jgi:hypothetical protein
MKNSGRLFPSIIGGLFGALIAHVIGRLCLWFISVGQQDFLVFLLIYLLPSPIVVGSVAGVLGFLSPIRYRRSRAGWSAFIGMLLAISGAFFLNVIVIPDPVKPNRLILYQTYYILLEIMVGILVQGLFFVLRQLLFRQTSKQND